MIKNFKIGLDIDGVVASFDTHFFDYLGLDNKQPAHSWDDPRFIENFDKVKHDLDFWLSMPALIKADHLDFYPDVFITARPIENKYSAQWLKWQGFKNQLVITVPSTKENHKSKVPSVLSSKLDYFVDDHVVNVNEINTQTSCICFLKSRAHNVKEGEHLNKLRIYHLNQLMDLI
jgi:uncharacterized HAD superfamily protein